MAYDAKLAGRRLLYTPSGGPQDYADSSDVRVEPSGTVPAHPFYAQQMGWEPEARYLDYEFEAAVDGFRRAAAQPDQTQRAPLRVDGMTAEAVGARMLGYLREVVGPEGRVF